MISMKDYLLYHECTIYHSSRGLAIVSKGLPIKDKKNIIELFFLPETKVADDHIISILAISTEKNGLLFMLTVSRDSKHELASHF